MLLIKSVFPTEIDLHGSHAIFCYCNRIKNVGFFLAAITSLSPVSRIKNIIFRGWQKVGRTLAEPWQNLGRTLAEPWQTLAKGWQTQKCPFLAVFALSVFGSPASPDQNHRKEFTYVGRIRVFAHQQLG